MNTANVMAISPQPGTSTKVQPARKAGKAGNTAADMEKDSFGEVLGKAGEDVTGKMPQSPAKAQQGSDQENASAQEAVPQEKLPKDDLSEEDLDAAEQLAGQAALINFSTEGKAQLVAEVVPEDIPKVDLQSLIPQSAEDMQKNKNFLAMLSGQQIQPDKKAETGAQIINVDSLQKQLWGQANSSQPATLLEVQLNNHQLANQQGELAPVSEGLQQPAVNAAAQLDNGKDTLAKGMALAEQSEVTMTSVPAGEVKNPAPLQENVNRGAVIAPVSVKTDDSEPVNNLLSGVNVTVEEEVPVVMPGMETRQFGGQPQGNQQPVQQEIVTAEDGAVTQLAEEAAGDKAPAKPVQSANNEAVSMFQQSLDESIRGTAQTRNTQDVQAPQEDFNVPRQIIDQARLLRRGEDTQMVIKLNPQHLGELTLKVSVSANGAVNASFHSDNAQVRAIIENSLVQLKQELNNQGLKVDNVAVYAGLADGQLPQGEGQQAWQQNQGQTGSNTSGNIRLQDVDEYGEETAAAAAGALPAETAAADGVDYRI